MSLLPFLCLSALRPDIPSPLEVGKGGTRCVIGSRDETWMERARRKLRRRRVARWHLQG